MKYFCYGEEKNIYNEEALDMQNKNNVKEKWCFNESIKEL